MEYPEIKKWTEGYTVNVDRMDFLSQNCTLGTWVALVNLMFPKFVQDRGRVIWESAYSPDGLESWHRELASDVRRIEATLNRLVLEDIVEGIDAPEDRSALKYIAEAIAKTWSMALESSFPEKRFDVYVSDTEDGPVVSFVSAE